MAQGLSTDIGWRWLGYTLQEGDGRLEVITFWLVEEVPSDPMRWVWYMRPFHHLLDPEGRQVENPSGFGVPGSLWAPGDIYIDRTVMPLPAVEGLRLEIGLFDPNRGVRARFQGPDGVTDALLIHTWTEPPSGGAAGGR